MTKSDAIAIIRATLPRGSRVLMIWGKTPRYDVQTRYCRFITPDGTDVSAAIAALSGHGCSDRYGVRFRGGGYNPGDFSVNPASYETYGDEYAVTYRDCRR